MAGQNSGEKLAGIEGQVPLDRPTNPTQRPIEPIHGEAVAAGEVRSGPWSLPPGRSDAAPAHCSSRMDRHAAMSPRPTTRPGPRARPAAPPLRVPHHRVVSLPCCAAVSVPHARAPHPRARLAAPPPAHAAPPHARPLVAAAGEVGCGPCSLLESDGPPRRHVPPPHHAAMSAGEARRSAACACPTTAS
ncbi:atherin-like [Panicum virgatum]|uniref:atherin-like n=1 Tax=Panicum virgatum TaxID=38727 RepID=UPI0019D5A9C9|nr:atherin-like [Panicum virgatum]